MNTVIRNPNPRPSSFTGKWTVAAKGLPGARQFEIAVVRADNAHGFSSFGWFKEDEKLLITHNGGPCEWPICEFVWNRAIETAQAYAALLNYQEAKSPD